MGNTHAEIAGKLLTQSDAGERIDPQIGEGLLRIEDVLGSVSEQRIDGSGQVSAQHGGAFALSRVLQARSQGQWLQSDRWSCDRWRLLGRQDGRRAQAARFVAVAGTQCSVRSNG